MLLYCTINPFPRLILCRALQRNCQNLQSCRISFVTAGMFLKINQHICTEGVPYHWSFKNKPPAVPVRNEKEAQRTCCWIIGNREGIWPRDSQKRKYYVYRYEGNLNGIENAVVLLSYPEKAFGNPKALRAFISTNVALSTLEILSCYVCRWPIEVFFRQCKTRLALDTYQIRSSKGIQRYWLLMSMAHYICVIALDDISLSRKDINWFAVPFSRKSINICFNVQNPVLILKRLWN